MPSFTGTITTTGKSEAIRLEKALFRLHPEFRQRAKVRAHVIAPGQALISVMGQVRARPSGEDPVVRAFLGFLEQDMKTHPARIKPLSRVALAKARKLVKGVRVSDADCIPEDITL